MNLRKVQLQKIPQNLLLCSILLSSVSCAVHKPMTNFANLKNEYLDSLFLAKPHLATFMGDHRFDDRFSDLSSPALKLRERVLEQQRLRLNTIDKAALSADDQIDAEILADGIALELLYLREIKDWQWDPRLYDSFPYYDPREMVAGRISDIIHGHFAPLPQRLKSVAGFLKNLPTFLKQVQDQLQNPSQIYTEQAIDDNRGRIDLFKGEVQEFIRESPGLREDVRAEAEKARLSAVKAWEDYQTFLESSLLSRSSGEWRLGRERYDKKFSLALQTQMTPELIVPRAKSAFDKARQELLQVAVQLQKELLPKTALPAYENDPKAQTQLIRAVRDELSKDHPKAEDLVEAHRRNLDDFRRFIEAHHLLELPPKETLVVREIPLFKRGVTAAEYLAPGVLQAAAQWQATYYVDPINPSWDAARVESYLRGNNTYEVELTAMHEAYPGHHTQYYYARKNPNPLRSVLWNAPFVEGWAVYGEDLMTRLGFGGRSNLRYQFFARRGDMIVATNILIDIKLHCGEMTDDEAERFMVEEGFQEQAQAEKKLRRAKLDSTQLAQYFLGYDEIMDLERAYRQVKKEAFDQREFNESLIGHGPIAVKHLQKFLLQK